MKNFFVIILLLLAAFFGYTYFFQDEEIVISDNEDEPEVIDAPVKGDDVESDTLFEEGEFYIIDVEYPVTDNEIVDSQIQTFITTLVDSFKEFLTKDSEGLFLSPGRKYMFGTTFEAKIIDEKYETYIFYIHEDTGGAHPNTVVRTLTFDQEGEQQMLQDIVMAEFGVQDGIAEEISQVLVEKLKVQLGDSSDGSWIEDGAGPDLANFDTFYVMDDSFTFIFSPYAIGPRVLGIVETEIPFSDFNFGLESDEKLEE